METGTAMGVERLPLEFYLSTTGINNNCLGISDLATLDEHSYQV